MVFGAIMAVQFHDWTNLLIVAGCDAVFLLITFAVFKLALSAEDPQESYEMSDIYVKVGYGRSSVYFDYDKAKEYLNTLLGDVRAMSPKYNTGDEMLDCIVGMKSAKMEEQGIDFTLEGVIDGGLGMKPMDICSIFANAFDNAIEACEKPYYYFCGYNFKD